MKSNSSLDSFIFERDSDNTVYLSFIVYGGVSVNFGSANEDNEHTICLTYDSDSLDTKSFNEFSRSFILPEDTALSIEFEEIESGVAKRPKKPKVVVRN